jgi:hypothetical protein
MPHDSPNAAPAGAAVVRLNDPDHLIATWRNVVILVWRRETLVAAVDAAQDVYDKLALANPGGLFLLTVVEAGAPPPSQEARYALARFLSSGAGRMILSAVVHEGSGFRAAFVRGVVTGLALLANLPYPHKVFGSVEEAATWFRMKATAPRSWGEQELVLAVKELRQRAAVTERVVSAGTDLAT